MSNPLSNQKSMYRTLPHDVRADTRLIGSPNTFYSFCQFTSSARTGMFGHNLPQIMVNRKPEFDRIFPGTEYDLGTMCIDNSKRDQAVKILEILPKYKFNDVVRGNIETCPEFLVIYVGEDDRKLGYFTIDRYHMGMNGFGFMTNIQNKHRISRGSVIEKDMPIATSPALMGSRYTFSVNMNVCYGSFAETIEDAFIISETAANKLMTDMIYQVPILSRPDRRPINKFGTPDVEKPFPDIGTIIGKDGILHAARPVNWMTCTADTDPRSMMDALPLQDDIYYAPVGSEIIDLDFVANRNALTSGYSQVQQYLKCNEPYWMGIYKTYLKYKNEYKLTDDMYGLLRQAIYRLLATGVMDLRFMTEDLRKIVKSAEIESPSGGSLEFLHSTITYRCDRKVVPGEKVSGKQGNKGVVGCVYPDDRMPVDDHGNRADLMIAMSSPLARTNLGQLYEQGLNRISEDVRKKAEGIYKVRGVEPAFETIVDFANDVNPNYATILWRKLNDKKRRDEYVKNCIADCIHLWVPPFHENFCPTQDDLWNALRNMKKWQKKWGVEVTPITYWLPQGDGQWRKFRTEVPVLIGSEAIIHVNKIPKISAPGCSRVNHLGIPTKSSAATDMSPIKMNPLKFGEDEHRMSMMDVDVRWVVRLQNLYGNSPFAGVNRAIDTILRAEKPSNIPIIPVSNGDLMEQSVILRLFHNTMAILGFDSRDTRIEGYELPPELAAVAEAYEEYDGNTIDPLSDSTTTSAPKPTTKGRGPAKKIPLPQ